RDVAVEGGVVCAVHGRHAAAPDALHHPVGAEGRALPHVHRITSIRARRPIAAGSVIRPKAITSTAKRATGHLPTASKPAAFVAARPPATSSIKVPRTAFESSLETVRLAAHSPKGQFPTQVGSFVNPPD